MRKSIKKLIACLCCAAMIIPMCAIAASSDDEDAGGAESAAASVTDYAMNSEVPLRTDSEAMKDMKLAAENDKLALYYNDSEITFALADKNTGAIWWSNPINADASAGKGSQRTELKSGMTLTAADPGRRASALTYSKDGSDTVMKAAAGGLEVKYDFRESGITIPVKYTLCEDYLSLYIDTSGITENDPSSQIVTDLAVLTSFGAADTEEEGYFVVPDGSGAVINFNNNKANYKVYKNKVYGRDITVVENTKPSAGRQVYLPMFGIVKGSSGIMAVADKGDTCATINAYTAGQKSTSYNSCYFDFELRTEDDYLMGGETNPLKVFEKRGILVPEIEVRYYPVSNPDKSELDFTDIAAAYRNYLVSAKGAERSPAAGKSAMYIDFYGGTMKKESVLGIPVNMPHKATSFSDAQMILEKLKALGVENIVVNYNQWTAADIKGKVADKAKPASVLGGKKDFNALVEYADANGIALYPAVDNITFKSGGGYFTMTDTVIRVSNAYSRQIEYDLAHGVENKFYRPLSLLSPKKHAKMFENLGKSYSGYGLENISLGRLATVIYGDYGKKSVSREKFRINLEGYLGTLRNSVPSIYADGANSYVIAYADHIGNVPLSSSKYDVFDGDIPFYQAAMSGLKPVSTTAVNGDAQVADLVLRAVACGSNLRFDFTADDADGLKDTLYDKLFYTNYRYWLEDAAGCCKFADEVLKYTAGAEMTAYRTSGSSIETEYSNGVKTRVDLNNKTVEIDGRTISLYDYIGKEVIG